MNKKVFFGLSFSFFFMFCGNAWAEMDCTNPSESQQLLECAKAKARTSEAKLNEAYRKLLKTIEGNCPHGSSYCSEIKKRLITSQRLWISLRQADCALETYQIEQGTAAFETVESLCLNKKAEARTGYLEQLSDQL